MRKYLSERASFLRLLSSAVATQAMLSATSFAIGLLLIRRTSASQYGYYVLIAAALLLATGLQWSFITPPMVIRLTSFSRSQRRNLIGGLLRDQHRLLPLLALVASSAAIVLRAIGVFDLPLTMTLVAGSAAVIAGLYRDFLRSTLFALRRPLNVFRADSVYCGVAVMGAFVATLTSMPAAVCALFVAVACGVGAVLLSSALRRVEPWNPHAPTGVLREFAPFGAWSALGCGVHWIFSQGYNYLAAGMLDVTAVAALAATRLLVMPVNLLSTGISTQMLPSVSRWLRSSKPIVVFERLALFALGLACVACCYLAAMWFARDWIFDVILKKNFSHRDLLLQLWCVIAVVMIFRDQLLHYLAARARFRMTSTLTTISAVIAVGSSVVAIRLAGVVGALVGLLIGEVFNVLSIAVLSIHDARQAVAAGRVSSLSTTADSGTVWADAEQDTEVYERSA